MYLPQKSEIHSTTNKKVRRFEIKIDSYESLRLAVEKIFQARSSLRVINIRNVALFASIPPEITQLLIKRIANCKKLRELRIEKFGNLFGELIANLAALLGISVQLRFLSFSGTYLGDSGMKALTASLIEHPFLQTLDLSDAAVIPDINYMVLANALQVNCSLTTLILHKNSIAARALKILATAIKSNKNSVLDNIQFSIQSDWKENELIYLVHFFQFPQVEFYHRNIMSSLCYLVRYNKGESFEKNHWKDCNDILLLQTYMTYPVYNITSLEDLESCIQQIAALHSSLQSVTIQLDEQEYIDPTDTTKLLLSIFKNHPKLKEKEIDSDEDLQPFIQDILKQLADLQQKGPQKKQKLVIPAETIRLLVSVLGTCKNLQELRIIGFVAAFGDNAKLLDVVLDHLPQLIKYIVTNKPIETLEEAEIDVLSSDQSHLLQFWNKSGKRNPGVAVEMQDINARDTTPLISTKHENYGPTRRQ